jgi:arginine decarboxylase
VHEVHVFLDESEPGGYYIEEVIKGSTIANVLSGIQYSVTDVEKKVKEQVDAKVREGMIKPREGVELLHFYERVLHGYTYGDYETLAKQAMVEAAPIVSEDATTLASASVGSALTPGSSTLQ